MFSGPGGATAERALRGRCEAAGAPAEVLGERGPPRLLNGPSHLAVEVEKVQASVKRPAPKARLFAAPRPTITHFDSLVSQQSPPSSLSVPEAPRERRKLSNPSREVPPMKRVPERPFGRTTAGNPREQTSPTRREDRSGLSKVFLRRRQERRGWRHKQRFCGRQPSERPPSPRPPSRGGREDS